MITLIPKRKYTSLNDDNNVNINIKQITVEDLTESHLLTPRPEKRQNNELNKKNKINYKWNRRGKQKSIILAGITAKIPKSVTTATAM